MSNYKSFLSDFIEIQRSSFFHFLEKGLIEEFSKRNPITDVKKEIELYFYPEYYQLTKPYYSVEQAILKNKSYFSKLYIPVQLTDRKRKKISLKWVLVAHLPLMTKHGHFIINGAPRIIVNQIVRSPGVYFQEKMHEIYINKWNDKPDISLKRYYADIICSRGSWLRFEIDRDKQIWAQMKKGPKIPVLWLLIGMGLTDRVVFQSLSSSERLIENFRPKSLSKSRKEYLYVQNPPEAWKQIYLIMNPNKLKEPKNSSELGRRWLFKKFMNPRTYDLGKKGRMALNQKLGLTIALNQTTLTSQDLLAITEYLLKVEKGIYPLDDIDHLKNRRVRSAGDLLQTQFGIGLLRLEKNIRDKLNRSIEKPTLNFLVNSRAINGSLKEFFGSNPLSQFMDQINPLSEMTHKRRLSSLGIGGVSRDAATLAIRGIHPTHYGRICPIETPEGKNTGLVNSMTTYSKVNLQGLLESPFYKVYKGQTQKHAGMIYLSAEQEEKMKIATADLNFTPLGFLPKESIPGRSGKDFTRMLRSQIQYVGVSPVQMISVATSLIPFLEHDDANRALMGSNMQRQAVPLIRPERPLVGTGFEARAVSDSGHAIISKKSGFVTYVSGSKIKIYSIDKYI